MRPLHTSEGVHRRRQWSPAEIEAILAELGRLLVLGGFAGSIGVVTSFREQANRLHDHVDRALPVDISVDDDDDDDSEEE